MLKNQTRMIPTDTLRREARGANGVTIARCLDKYDNAYTQVYDKKKAVDRAKIIMRMTIDIYIKRQQAELL